MKTTMLLMALACFAALLHYNEAMKTPDELSHSELLGLGLQFCSSRSGGYYAWTCHKRNAVPIAGKFVKAVLKA